MRYLVAPVIAVAFLQAFSRPAAAQPPPAAGDSQSAWVPPRLSDGHPDLQGVWLNNSATPLERPKALEGRTALTDEEVTELQKRAARLLADPSNDFAAGDNLFLAAWENVAEYKNPNVTGNATDMIEREFDNRTSLIVDPADGRIPWTAEGKQRYDASAAARRSNAAANPEELALETRCITYGVPRLGLNNVNSAGPLGYYQIVQAPGYVVLFYEAIHEARIIPLDRPLRLPARVWQWSGESTGHWEGSTLVVETARFSPDANVMGSGERLQLTERFTRVALDRISYEITLSDPLTWARPWTVEIRLKQSRDPIYEYACHEGSAPIIQDLLNGSRAEDQSAVAVKKR
jgi:hypothetical protein